MARLASVVDKLDAVPEALRGSYVEQDGKFVLDADVDSHPAVQGLKVNRDTVLREKREVEGKLKAFGNLTPEQVTQLQTEHDEQERTRATKAGEFEGLKTKLLEKHQGEINEREAKIKRRDTFIDRILKQDYARRVITALEGEPDILLPHVVAALKVEEDGEDYRVLVVDSKGNPRIGDSKGTPMTVEQLVGEFKAHKTFGKAFKGNAASGSGANNDRTGGGNSGVGLISRADAKNPAVYRRIKAEADKAGVELQYSD